MSETVMMVERFPFRWEACVVRLTAQQERELESDPSGETVDGELHVIRGCGHRHIDPDSKAATKCWNRMHRT